MAWKDCTESPSPVSFLASAILERKCRESFSTSSSRMISASLDRSSTSSPVSSCSSLDARLFFQLRLNFRPLEVCMDPIRRFIFSTQRLLAWIFARIFLLMVLARMSSNSSLSLSLSRRLNTSASSRSFPTSSLNLTPEPRYFPQMSILRMETW